MKKNLFHPLYKKQEEEFPKDITRELAKKNKEKIDYTKKQEYLKKRIETLKSQEEKMKREEE